MKNFIYLLILFCIVIFNSCSKDNEELVPEEKEWEVTRLKMLEDTNDPNILPITYDPVEWKRNANGEIQQFSGFYMDWDVSHSEHLIQLTGISKNMSGLTVYDTLRLSLENGRIARTMKSARYVYQEDRNDSYEVRSRNFYYDEQGYLSRVTDPNRANGEQDLYRATVENGNVVKVETITYSDNIAYLEPFQITTHSYAYDNNDYIQMNDWAPYTPLYLVDESARVMLYDGLLGKKNKNNIRSVDLQYKMLDVTPHFNKLTYELKFDEQNKPIAIKHTGRFTGHAVEGGKQFDFTDNIETVFTYTVKEN
ncbi:MAG: hypothetical protein LBH04_02530 [Tannerellaceae bacterium]|jgi:hypothetical protein|nr:hypothetical protein [Tannerellaceae bacterium]